MLINPLTYPQIQKSTERTMKESKEFGATGEVLEATNYIGKIVSGLEFLKKLDIGDIIWVMEIS